MLPSIMKAPAAPPSTCVVVLPCTCGWYQYIPGESLAGTWKLYWNAGSPDWMTVLITSSW